MAFGSSLSGNKGRFSPGADSQLTRSFHHWKPLSQHHTSCLNHVLYSKDFHLKSKRGGVILPAIKAHQLFEAVMAAYVIEYGNTFRDLPVPTMKNFLQRHDLQVGLYIKGSTASSVLSAQDFSTNVDLDALIEFNKLPHDSSDASSNQLFYRKVAFQAVHSILTALYPGASGAMNPNDFFENLILFSDNSVFLMTIAGIDLAFPVPFIKEGSSYKTGSTFLHESLKIKIPCNVLRLNPAKEMLLGSEFEIDFSSLQKVFSDKIICIPRPEGILYNGYERLAYSLSKGWTTLDPKPVKVLIDDFYQRIQPSTSDTKEPYLRVEFPLERLYRLITKKQAQPVLAMNIFLNAYRLMNFFFNIGSPEAEPIKHELKKGFLESRWQMLFPGFVGANFDKERGLEFLVIYLNLQAHLSLGPYKSTLSPHLEGHVRVFGDENREIGFYLAEDLDFSSVLTEYQKLKAYLSEEGILKLFAASFSPYQNVDLPQKEEIFVAYMIRAISTETHQMKELEEIKRLFPRFVEILCLHPWIMRRVDFRAQLRALTSNCPSLFDLPQFQRTFLIELIENAEVFYLFPLFHQAMVKSSDEFKTILAKSQSAFAGMISEDLIVHVLVARVQDLTHFTFFDFLEKFSDLISLERLVDLLHRKKTRLKEAFQDQAFTSRINIQFWDDLLKKWILKNPSHSFDVVLPFFNEKRLFRSLFEFLLTQDLSDEWKQKIWAFCSSNNLIKELELLFELDKKLIHNEKFDRKMEIIDGFADGSKRLPAYVELIKSSYLHRDDATVNRPFAAFLKGLQVEDGLALVSCFLETKGDLTLLAFLFNQPFFFDKMASDKLKVIKILHKAAADGNFPAELAARFVSLILVDSDSSTLSDIECRFCFFCFKMLAMDETDKIQLFNQFISISYEKMIHLKNNGVIKDLETYKKLAHTSIFKLQKMGFALPYEWMQESMKTLVENYSLDEILALAENKELLFLKLEENPRLSSTQLKKVLDLFSDSPKDLSRLIFLLHESSQDELLGNGLQALIKCASLDFLMEHLNIFFFNERYNPLILDLLQNVKAKGFKIHPLKLKELATYLLSSRDEELKLKYLEYLAEGSDPQNLLLQSFFDLFSAEKHPRKVGLISYLLSRFERLDGERQNALFFAKMFTSQGRDLNLVELALEESSLFESLLGLINRINLNETKLEVGLTRESLAKLCHKAIRWKKGAGTPLIVKYLSFCKGAEPPVDLELLKTLMEADLKPDLMESVQGIIALHIDKLPPAYVLPFLHKKIAAQQRLRNTAERAMFDKIFTHLLENHQIEEIFPVFALFVDKGFFSDEQITALAFKAILKSLETETFCHIDLIIQTKGLKNFGKLGEKSKKGFSHIIEAKVEACHQIPELCTLIDVFGKLAPLFGTMKRFDQLVFKALQKYLDLLKGEFSKKELFDFIFKLEILSKLESKVNPSEKLITFETGYLRHLSDQLLSVCTDSLFVPITQVKFCLEKSCPEFLEIYTSKLISNHEVRLALELSQAPSIVLHSFLEFLLANDFYLKFSKPQLSVIASTLVRKGFLIYQEKAMPELSAATLLMILKFHSKVYSLANKEEIFHFSNLAINYLLQPERCLFVDDSTPLAVMALICEMSPEQKKVIFNPAQTEMWRFWLESIYSFFFLEKISLTPAAVKDLTAKGIAAKEAQFKARLEKQKCQLLSLMLQNLLVPLMKMDVDFAFCLFGILRNASYLDLTNPMIRQMTMNNLYHLSFTFMDSLPKGFVYDHKAPSLEHVLKKELFFSSPRLLKQQFVLQSMQKLFSQFVKLRVFCDMENWYLVPVMAGRFMTYGMVQGEEEGDKLVDNLKLATTNFLRFIDDHKIPINIFWPMINTQYLVNVNRILVKVAPKLPVAHEIFALQRVFIQKAVIEHQTDEDFTKNEHALLFSTISGDYVYDSLTSLSSHNSLMHEKFETKLYYFKFLFSILVNYRLREPKYLEPDVIREVYRLSILYFQALITDYLSNKKSRTKINRHLLFAIGQQLQELLPFQMMGVVFYDLKGMVFEELSTQEPNLEIFRKIFDSLNKLGNPSQAKVFLDILRESGKMPLFEKMEEFSALLEVEQKTDIPCSIC